MPNGATARSDDSPPSPESPGGRFAELRSLLVGPEQRQLRALQTRLDDPAVHARDISRVLPAAVELRSNDPSFKRALAPTIEETIAASVRRNPKPLADALFPIIGPAIRKAIAATLSGMLESLNTTLEHSLSWRSLRWRLDARRTGRSFAEVVLLNTLVYRVEQVFLIDRPSGLLLHHLSTRGTEAQDADMVSGMLTAIRDFVQDSFRVSAEEGLQTLKVGELSVWIEQGPHALLAAVIRGNAPPALRATMQQTLERMHAVYFDVLASFDGDASKLEGARPMLEDCVQQQYRTREGRFGPSPLLRAVAAILIVFLGVWAAVAIRARSRWNGYVAALAAEPGVVVVSTGSEDGKYLVSGMRDPLARDPSSLLSAHRLSQDRVVGRWQLYQALEPSLVLARAERAIKPPPTVTLRYSDGVLSAAGSASPEWIDAASRVAPALPGVTRFDAADVGEAAVRALIGDIGQRAPVFVKGSVNFTAAGEQLMREQVARLRSLEAIGRVLDRRFEVALVGQADADGLPDANLPLSEQRASRVLAVLKLEPFRARRVHRVRHWQSRRRSVCTRGRQAAQSTCLVPRHGSRKRSPIISPMLQKKICMLGGFGVGKTSLVSRFVSSMFSENYLTTVGVKVDKKTVELDSREMTMMLWDIYGQDDFQSVRESYLRGASGYLLVADGTRHATVDTAAALHQKAQSVVGAVPFLLLLNKADLASQWQIDERALWKLVDQGWRVVKTSAKTGTGVDDAFAKLARDMAAV